MAGQENEMNNSIIDLLSVGKMYKLLETPNFTYDQLLTSILNITESEADDWDIVDWENKIRELKGFNKNTGKYNKLEVDGRTFRYINFLNVSFAEFIDINNFWTGRRMDMLMSIFWRLEITAETSTENPVLEKYPIPLNKRWDILKSVSVKYYYRIEKDIEELNDRARKAYPMLYPKSDGVEEKDMGVENLNARDLILRKAEMKKKEAYQKDAWHHLLWKVSGGDITKWDDILKQPWWRVFTALKIEKIQSKMD
jgi:hypothetical protein